jgi:hypothetical protein
MWRLRRIVELAYTIEALLVIYGELICPISLTRLAFALTKHGGDTTSGCVHALHRDFACVNRHAKKGSDVGADHSSGADQSGLKQIGVAAAIHLTSDEFETVDLTFGLSVRPGHSDTGDSLSERLIFVPPPRIEASRLMMGSWIIGRSK